MLLSITNKDNLNYLAKVLQITNLEKHPEADRLMIANIDGNNVITTIDSGVVNGSYVCYFPVGSALSAKFLKMTNEFRDVELNNDPTAKPGLFDKHGRIKPVRLRNIPSVGYMVPIETVADYCGAKVDDFKRQVDTEFDTLNHEVFIKKYVPVTNTPGTGPKDRNAKSKKKVSRLVGDQFRLHDSTPQLNKNLLMLHPESNITITWKMHGTSFVSSRVLVKRELKWWEKVLINFGVKVTDREYDNIYSSRNVIKNEEFGNNSGGFYKSDIYKDVNEVFKPNLLKGETVYGEIVGFTREGREIQKKYDYGCTPEDPFKIYIYRVTHTNADDKVIELEFNQLVERASQLGVKSVPLLYTGKAKDFLSMDGFESLRDWRDAFLARLKALYVYDQDSIFCKNKVAEEGIVLRIEGLKPIALKLKAFRFLEHESKEHDKGIKSMEDEQSETSEE